VSRRVALELDHVSVDYQTISGRASAVSDVSFAVGQGEVFGLVGESGCGKSTLAMASMGLLPPSAQVTGEIQVAGTSIGSLGPEGLRQIRGNEISIIVPDPLTALDPMFSVGSQIVETIRAHRDVSSRAARERAVELLASVGIPDPQRRFKDPPHRFSGGMRQRVVIATALANDPAVLLADEPTTALDVTIQAQILELLAGLRRERGMAILLISHDLAVVSEVCDRVAVMYAGQLVEIGETRAVMEQPRHPYTRALLAAVPTPELPAGGLAAIPGEVPDPENPPPGCRFAPRCPHRLKVCDRRPALLGDTTSRVACWLYAEAEPPSGRDCVAEVER
jgi:oligopeptide/dipeptide ABC transporter ATP-binding protein